MVAGSIFPARASSSPGVILNETLARTLWPGEPAIGRSITIGCEVTRTELVRGVVRASAVTAVGEPPQPHVYQAFGAADASQLVAVVVEITGDAGAAGDTVRRSLVGLGGGIRVYTVEPLARYVEQSYGQFAWMTRLVSALGVLAMLLATAGLFGVMATRVSRRTREAGIRMALGANRRRLFRDVVAQGLGMVLIGLACGELLALSVFALVGSMQEGVTAPAAATHGVAALLWIGASVVACSAPALRAASVDPLIALRHD